MTPATARRLSALESAAATKTKDPELMSLDELQAAIAEHFGHVPRPRNCGRKFSA